MFLKEFDDLMEKNKFLKFYFRVIKFSENCGSVISMFSIRIFLEFAGRGFHVSPVKLTSGLVVAAAAAFFLPSTRPRREGLSLSAMPCSCLPLLPACSNVVCCDYDDFKILSAAHTITNFSGRRGG